MQQSDFIGRRQEATGQWLLDSEQFKDWVDGAGGTLFCHGIPGAGKSMLASIVNDHLEKTIRHEAHKAVGIAYIFCSYRSQQEQTTVNLLASLLKQLLLAEESHISNDVTKLYENHRKRGTRPTLEEVFKVFEIELSRYAQVYIVVDALDECSDENGIRQQLLSKLRTLQATGNMKLMATSRPIPSITKEFEGSIRLEIRAKEEDLQIYLEGHMGLLASCVKKSTSLQTSIKSKIIKAADGMYVTPGSTEIRRHVSLTKFD